MLTKLQIFTNIALGEMPEQSWFEGWRYEELREVADFHRVLCMVAKWYPEDSVAVEDLKRITLRELQVKRLTSKLVGELERAEIDVYVFKGPSLQSKLDDPFPRESRDIDLLVKKDDLVRAYHLISSGREPMDRCPEKEIASEDWNSKKDLIIINGNPKIRIELHWRLLYTYFDQDSSDELWKYFELSQGGNSCFDLERIEFEALSTHAVQHGFSRVRWVRDLQLMRKKFCLDFPNTIEGHCTKNFIAALNGSTVHGLAQELHQHYLAGINSGSPENITAAMQRKIRWRLCKSIKSKFKMLVVHFRLKALGKFVRKSKMEGL
jgi:hypothetical protein